MKAQILLILFSLCLLFAKNTFHNGNTIGDLDVLNVIGHTDDDDEANGPNHNEPHPPPPPSPLLVYHGGPVAPSLNVTIVYWGPSWISTNEIVHTMPYFIAGLNGSNYYKTNDQYTGTGGVVPGVSKLVYSGDVIDNSAVPTDVSLGSSDYVSKVCGVVQTLRSVATITTHIAVMVSQKRGSASFCAWHTYVTCSGISHTITASFYFNATGDAGCSLYSNASQTIANLVAHELSETYTDPEENAWYDASGEEAMDKCAWDIPANGYVLSNGETWYVQKVWSNTAYNANQGTPRGCV